jgi:hypothetical protein
MVDACPGNHCSSVQGPVNEVCKATGWGVNHPVVVQMPNGTICFCTCSCLAFGTPVEAGGGGYRAIEQYAVGDTVLACGLGLNWQSHTVEFSNGTAGASKQKYTVLVTYANTALAVTSDHIFLLADKTLKRADRLAPGDNLLSVRGDRVPITSVHIGDYYAGFHHIATKQEEPPANLEGHLLNTNGIVSADYAVQLYCRDNNVRKKYRFAANHDDLPIVGSPAYMKIHGRVSRQAPTATSFRNELQTHYLSVSQHQASDLKGPVFVPANATIVQIPSDAASFISKEEAEAKAAEAMRPWNDPLSRQWTQYLLDQYGAFYPQIAYQLDWADDTVNAFAWIDATGTRHVAIKGGLVRHFALQMEGIALVIAHETGHHYGGPPTFPSGLSCEGQADFAGVRDVMRKAWFGDQYAAMVIPAIAQMANFFGVPNSPIAPGGSAGCDHPPGACRIATYYGAFRLAGKPSCAS